MADYSALPMAKDVKDPYADLPMASSKIASATAPQPVDYTSYEDVFPGGAKSAPAPAEAKPEQPKFSYDELYSNPDIFKVITDYAKVGMGTTYKEGTDKKEFVNKFMSNMRGEEWNTFSNVAALNTLRNAPLPDKEKLALGNRLFEQVADATSKTGQPGVAPYLDIAKAAFTDLTNYIGFGVGTGLKKVAAKKATELATRSAIGEAGEAAAKSKIARLLTPTGITAATTATEATIGVGQSAVSQKQKQEVAKAMQEEPKDLDPVQLGVAAVFGAFGGFIEGRAALATTGGKSGAEQFSEKLMKAKVPTDPNAPITPFEKMISDPITENMDEVVSQFNKQEGRRILGEIDPATALTDSKIQSDLSARAVRVAMHVIDADPTFRVKPNQKTSDALANVFSNLDTIDDAILEQAIRKEGLSPEQFAQANLMTVSDAARVMQQYSAASKILNRMTQIDPEVGKLVDNLFNKPDEYVTALGRVGQGIRTLERESKAFIVSGIGTTVRNVLGTSVGLTYNSAASLLEGAMYTVGRTLDGAATGKRIETAMSSLGDTFRDAFSVYGYMAKNGLSTEVTNNLLQHNPALRNNLLSATQESTTTELSKAAQIFNTLNVAQDSFFRKAIFNAAVEKHMRRAGLDMYEVIADGKAIPASILKQATDETLKATFSYTPKAQKKGIETFESGAEAAGNLFVKAAEFPGGSLLATFPRFMSNAIAFQYRYSVFGAASGAEDLYRGALMKAAGSNAGDGLIRQGQENIAKGVVGTAALAAAYDYRLNNQDVDAGSMKMSDGSTVDMRGIFPLGPTLIVADFMAKQKLGIDASFKDAQEAILGMKMPAGTQNYLMDKIFNVFTSEKDADSFSVAAGKVFGDFTARFSQPFVFKSAYEFLDLFRKGGAIQRDPNIIEAESTAGRFFEAAGQRVQAKLPIIKESLPEAIPRLREGPVYKEGEFFYSLIGVRETPKKTPAEAEIVRLGIDPYKLYGPSSGNKLYDREFVKEANPLVIQTVERVISDDRYKQLSPTEQKLALGKSVSEIVGIARNINDAKFMSKDLLQVKKMQFNKLTGDERKIINESYAKDHDGKTLEDANDYMQVDAYKARLGSLRFAVGGFASRLLGKTASSTADDFLSKIKTAAPSTPVDSSVIDSIVKKNISAVSASIAEQTTKAIPTGKKTAAKKTVAAAEPTPAPTMADEIPSATTSEAPIARQMEEAMPTPTEAVPEAPTSVVPSVAEESTGAIKAYTPEQYAIGEKDLIESEKANPIFGMQYLKDLKTSNPDEYMSIVHSYTNSALGIKSKDAPENPFTKKADEFAAAKKEEETAAAMIDETVVDKYGSSKSESFVKPRLSEEKIEQSYAGDVNKQVNQISTKQRNAIVDAIKDKREKSFFKLRNSLDFADIDDEVLGTMLGEYRAKYNVELSPTNKEDIVKAKEMATQLQAKLDDMRERYKDKPPERLYHGGLPENIAKLKQTGFFDPSKYSREHAEMNVGAPSFTKDLNLGFQAKTFGGRNPENYLYTEIPYADYQFSRINMRPEQYDVKDMNTIIRSITGAPDVVRPISLPRAGYLETEDMIVEANKLRVKDGNVRLKAVGDENEEFKRALEGIKSPAELLETRNAARDLIDDALVYNRKGDKKESIKTAYKSYSAIRDLMNDYMNMSKGAVRAGTGQQYQSRIDQLIDYGHIINKLPAISDILKNAGATQRADKLMELRDTLREFSATDPGAGGVGSNAKQETMRKESLQKVREITPKLARGGLASRR